ncbi:hypothetical protein [Methylocaldum sp.]|uniref:hypothetical protein n=1 Tax=Methylocaldum sp. TaxID=1969727 RepID=UPI002D700572|nr:hypothetical protein [Methylocaldum sp.]HYE35600.1 hypothetical protein [Methylocaldum sp.]
METFIGRRKFIAVASSFAALLTAGFGQPTKADTGNKARKISGSVAAPQRNPGAENQPIPVFDVNEPLLDLNALRPHFQRIVGDGRALDQWFFLLLQYSLVVNVADAYTDFGTVGRAVLEMLAVTRRVPLSPEDETKI